RERSSNSLLTWRSLKRENQKPKCTHRSDSKEDLAVRKAYFFESSIIVLGSAVACCRHHHCAQPVLIESKNLVVLGRLDPFHGTSIDPHQGCTSCCSLQPPPRALTS